MTTTAQAAPAMAASSACTAACGGLNPGSRHRRTLLIPGPDSHSFGGQGLPLSGDHYAPFSRAAHSCVPLSTPDIPAYRFPAHATISHSPSPRTLACRLPAPRTLVGRLPSPRTLVGRLPAPRALACRLLAPRTLARRALANANEIRNVDADRYADDAEANPPVRGKVLLGDKERPQHLHDGGEVLEHADRR